MPLSHRFSYLTIVAVCSALLSACGGGGSSSSAASATPASVSRIGGTVAVGAPMLNATVTVKDVNGLTRSVTAAADGSYSGLSVDGMTGPFRIQACGLVDGHSVCYYAVVDQAGTANVTPLTHATASLALGQDAATLFDTNAAAPSSAALDAKKQRLLAALAPVIAAVGLPAGVDFASVAFSADRTGVDKLLDAVKITTGTDVGSGNQATTFVQVEGKIGAGNVFLGSDGANSGSLSAGADLSIDLRGISTVFERMSTAVGAATESACGTSMAGAGIFDAAFSLNIDGNMALTADTAPAAICHFAAQGNLLGGVFANPVLRDCDFSGSDKICTAGFDIVKGDVVFDGAELAVVLRSGTTVWKLLGRESAYEIHVGAAVQRTLRVDISDPQTKYTRALSFDVGDGGGTVHAARVYQHDASGSGWDATPIAVLDDNGCLGVGRLTIRGSSCGSSWVSLDNFGANLTDGDALIDAFYKRGRQVKIELYSDVAATTLAATVTRRVDGVPPKAAALVAVPWLELDGATRAALVSYAGASPNFMASWGGNASVSAKDITFCLSGNCSGTARAAHEQVDGSRNGAPSKSLTLNAVPANASAFKQISLYGRNREQMGVSTNYVSCGGAVNCN